MKPPPSSPGATPTSAAVAEPPPFLVPPRRRFRWRYLLLGMAAAFVVGIVALVLSFLPGGDVRAMKAAVFESAPGAWERQIEFGIGRLPLFMARTGLNYIDVDPRARLGARALRCVDVGIYRRKSFATDPRSESGLAEVRSAMASRGWSPVVAVHDCNESVLVFLRSGPGRDASLRACVCVIDRDQAVLVSAQARLQPLMELARDAMAEHPLDEILEDQGHGGLWGTLDPGR